MKERDVARTILDVLGRKCPMPIIELTRLMPSLAAGDEVEVRADDRAFPMDVRAWCRRTANELVSLETDRGSHVALVKKGSSHSGSPGKKA